MLFTIEKTLTQLGISASAFRRVEVAQRWSPAASAVEQVHLIIVLRGEGALSLEAAMMPLSAGELLVVGGRQRLQLDAVGACAGLTIAHGVLDATLLDGRDLFDFIAAQHAYGVEAQGGGALAQALGPPAPGEAGSAALMICLIRRVVARLLRERWSAQAQVGDEKLRAQRQRLSKIIDLMRKDPARRYTLQDLAGVAGMSRTAFHKMFTETYGNSPLVLLREMRLSRAQELLADSSLSIKTISARLGYRSRSHFWQAFKQAYGMAPESYRHHAQARAPLA